MKRQNELSLSLAISHQQSALPKKEISIFDGTDVTKFKTFLLSFERIIENICNSDSDKLIYLEQFTSGKAKKLVQSCAHFDVSVAFIKAKALLIQEYGNEFRISSSYIEKLDEWPIIRPENVEDLENLYIFLINCNHYIENLTWHNQLQNPKEIMNIVAKLPYKLRDRWRRHSHSASKKYGIVSFKLLGRFYWRRSGSNEATYLWKFN